MSELTLYVRPCDNPTHMRQGHYGGCYEPVEPVAVTVMNDYIDGFYQVADVYAPDLTNEAYKVAVVILEADDE